ncbi:hypothetical protein N4G58_18420 [Edwardsiella piscicida]|nr:hypothetical protein N4G58_18420 [Edwardsiella piscicida]
MKRWTTAAIGRYWGILASTPAVCCDPDSGGFGTMSMPWCIVSMRCYLRRRVVAVTV